MGPPRATHHGDEVGRVSSLRSQQLVETLLTDNASTAAQKNGKELCLIGGGAVETDAAAAVDCRVAEGDFPLDERAVWPAPRHFDELCREIGSHPGPEGRGTHLQRGPDVGLHEGLEVLLGNNLDLQRCSASPAVTLLCLLKAAKYQGKGVVCGGPTVRPAQSIPGPYAQPCPGSKISG